MAQKISYKPNLDYEKHYETDGIVSDNKQEVNQTSNVESPKSSLEEKINKIISVLPFIDEDTREPIIIFLNTMNNLSEVINEESEDHEVEEPIEVFSPDISLEDPDNSDESEKDPDIINLNIDNPDIIVHTYDQEQQIKINFAGDLQSLTLNALDKLEDYLTYYLVNILKAKKEAKVKDIKSLLKKYKYNPKKGISEGNRHLSDVILKSQAVRDQKLRLMNKLYTISEASRHVTNCRYTKDMKTRYNNADYLEKTDIYDYLDTMNDVILSESRIQFEKKYEDSIYNLYKYLNSSVILINDCLNLSLNESRCKAELYKKGEIKL